MLSDFLTELASSINPVPWTAWLPLITEAQSPDSWKNAWAGLSGQAQLRVVRHFHANPNACTDVLLQLTIADSKSLPTYGPARELLLDDAAEAAGRNVQRLRNLQHRLKGLGLILDDTRTSELDIEAKIVELEGRVAVFRADDVEGRYSELLALREEEIRLRRVADELGDFDLTDERNRLAQLNQNIADAQKQRTDVLDSIKEKKKTLAAMRQETTELSAECARLTTEEREATAE